MISKKELKNAEKIEDKTAEFQYFLSKIQKKVKNDKSEQIIDKTIAEIDKTNLKALSVIVKSKKQTDPEIIEKIDNKINETIKIAKAKGDKEIVANLKDAKNDLMNKKFVAALAKIEESKDKLSNTTVDFKDKLDNRDESKTENKETELKNSDENSTTTTTTIEIIDNNDKMSSGTMDLLEDKENTSTLNFLDK